jgi:hypothetical protein
VAKQEDKTWVDQCEKSALEVLSSPGKGIQTGLLSIALRPVIGGVCPKSYCPDAKSLSFYLIAFLSPNFALAFQTKYKLFKSSCSAGINSLATSTPQPKCWTACLETSSSGLV